MKVDQRTLPAGSELALSAYLWVIAGSSVATSLVPLVGVPITVTGFVLACVALVRASDTMERRGLAWPCAWLSACTAVSFTAGPPEHSPMWYAVAYRVPPVLGLFAIGVVAGGGAVAARRAAWIAVAGATALQLATPIAISHPEVDVWSWTQTCVHSLLQGVHPYTAQAEDIYRGGYDFGYRVTVYPYMPLTLLVTAPGAALFGDYRFGLAACLPLAVALLRRAGRRMSVDPHLLNVATLALALHPRGAYIIANGWIEPAAVALLAGFVYVASIGPARMPAAVMVMLLPALKQYMLAPALLLLALRPRWRAIAAGAGVAIMTTVPFLLWDWRPTVAGMLAIFNQMGNASAFRDDSDSISALVARLWGIHAPRALGIATQLLVVSVTARTVRALGLAGLLLASGVALVASFLVGTQAFMNYYDCGAAFLLFGAVTLAREDGRR